jgi:hypothetical protein
MRLLVCALAFFPNALVYADGLELLKKELQEVRQTQRELKKREAEITDQILAIEASVDKTRGVSPRCPVHKVEMTPTRVVIAYGMMAKDPSAEARGKDFPFAANYILGGCVESSRSPSHGKKYICPRCVDAEKRWKLLHPRREPIAGPLSAGITRPSAPGAA